mmetsp:Transcript_51466/g.137091  ORF Transcript_51466/g.137091 Transcript_51466/m.137091 type:complete len:302 (-) Transcript_51466:427-1332(-)
MNLSWCSLLEAACFCLRSSSCDTFLNSAGGSPTKTIAEVLMPADLKGSRDAALSSLIKLPFTSITTALRFWSAQRVVSIFLTLEPSSSLGTPKPISGLSLELFGTAPLFCQLPLFSTHSRTARSLISTYPGLFSRNMSSQSKLPSSGRLTGKSTSAASVAVEVLTSAWDLGAEATMWHVKGSGHSGSGPKFACKVMHLNATVGKRALPSKLSGTAWGCEIRLPPLKRLMVLQFGLPLSRFSKHATTLPPESFWLTFLPDLMPLKWPSESKLTLASVESMSSDELATEKPIFSKFWGCGPLL